MMSSQLQNGDPVATVEVPILNVDSVRVALSAFTVHLQFGSTMPGGATMPRVHLAVSTEFARYLREVLDQALQERST